MNPELRDSILNANRDLHAVEAPAYDSLHGEIFNAWNERRLRRLVKRAKGLIVGRRALDLGTGTGAFATILARDGFTVTGVDLSPEMLAIFSKKLDPAIAGNVTLVNAELGEFLSRRELHFDLITCSSVLHHLPDYLEICGRVAEMLSPSGVFISTHEPSPRCRRRSSTLATAVVVRAERLFHPINETESLDYSLADYHATYGTFSAATILKMFEARGFSTIHDVEYAATPKTATFSAMANVAAFVFPPLRTHSEFMVQAPPG